MLCFLKLFYKRKETLQSRLSQFLVRRDEIYERLPCRYSWERLVALQQLPQTLAILHSKSPERRLATFNNKRATQTVPDTMGNAESTAVSGLDIVFYL